MSMWLGWEIVVAGLPLLGQKTAERMSCDFAATYSNYYYGDNLRWYSASLNKISNSD